MKDGLIPIIQLPPGVCKNCKSTLNVILSDMVSVGLNEAGMPVSSEVYRSSVKGICPKCLTEHPMVRRGLFYVPDTPWGKTVDIDESSVFEPRVVKGDKKENPFIK